MKNSQNKKRKLPKDITERSDREVMERIFGKRIMKKVDALTERGPETVEREGG